MMRALVLSGLLAVAPVALLSGGPAQAQADNGQKCQDNAQKKAKRSMFGGLANAIGGSILGRVGGGQVWSLALPATSYLGDELLKMLDCKEQEQAAKATDQAIRGGVGTEVSWKSESRPNVTGTQRSPARKRWPTEAVPDGDRRGHRRWRGNDGAEENVQAKGASAYARV